MAEQAQRNPLVVPILAGLAGAGIALLFAPRSGRETRNQLETSTQESMDAARDRVNSGLAQAREMKDRLQSAAESTGRKARQEIDKLKKKDQQQESPMTNSWEQEA